MQKKEKTRQLLKKNEVEFISVVWCLPSVFSFWIHLWLFISSKSQCGLSNFWQHHLYHIHLLLEGGFCCD